MRITFCILLLTLSVAGQNRGFDIEVRDDSGKAVLNYQKSYAVVFAVSDYTNGWQRLPGVKEDAEEVKKALEKQGFKVYVIKNPSAKKMRSVFRGFIRKFGLKKSNRLLFYYCGHGYTDDGLGGKMGYVVPVEAAHPEKNKEQFLSDAISMEEIKTYSKLMRCYHALFLFDSCFAGTIFENFRSSTTTSAAINYKMSRPVRQFITSGSENEQVPDTSLFRYHFVEALSGEGDGNKDGYITGTELGQYLQDQVINYSKDTQHPQYGKLRNPKLDKGDFVFVLKNTTNPEELKRRRSQLSDYQKILRQEQQQKKIEREKIEQANREMKKIEAEIAATREKMRFKNNGSKLDDLLVLLDKKRTWAATLRRLEEEQKERERKERQRLAALKQKRIQQVKDKLQIELPKYRRIATSEFASEMKGDAWNALLSSCPDWWQAQAVPKYDEKLLSLSPSERQQNAKKQPQKQQQAQRLGFTYLRTQTYSCNGNSYTVKEYRHNTTGMEFVQIPSASFVMGGDGGSSDEKPAHRVQLSSFLIAKTEVTQGVWRKIMGTAPWKGKSYVKEGDMYAATHISWNDAKQFCDRVGLELPTEAQWEYACGSGSNDSYYWGNKMDGAYAWYRDNANNLGNQYAHKVGLKKANAFGLYDMTGNVWEWCADWYDKGYYANSLNVDPKGPSSGSYRVSRGGCWYSNASYCRSRDRSNGYPGLRINYVGFRPSVHYP